MSTKTALCTCQKYCQAPPEGKAIPICTWYSHAAQHNLEEHMTKEQRDAQKSQIRKGRHHWLQVRNCVVSKTTHAIDFQKDHTIDQAHDNNTVPNHNEPNILTESDAMDPWVTFLYLLDIWLKSFKSKFWTQQSIQFWSQRPTLVLFKLQARQATIWSNAWGSCVYGVHDFADPRLFIWLREKPMDRRWIQLILKSYAGAVEFGQSTTLSVIPNLSISLCPFLWDNLWCNSLKYQGMLSYEHHALVWPGPKLIGKNHGHPSITLWYVCQYLPCIYQPLWPPHCMSLLWRALISAISQHWPQNSSLSIYHSSNRASITSFVVTSCLCCKTSRLPPTYCNLFIPASHQWWHSRLQWCLLWFRISGSCWIWSDLW